MFLVRTLILSLCVVLAAPSAYSQNVLNAGTHAADHIAPAINAVLGSGHVDTDIYVDYDGSYASMANTTVAHSAATGQSVNHSPYRVGNNSNCPYSTQTDFDAAKYLQPIDGQYTMPLGESDCFFSLPAPYAGPGVYVSAASSTNSSNGGTSWGIEFGISPGYLGLDTSLDSWDSAYMAAFIASLLKTHPSWHGGDAKAALRQTAANWATGYDHTNYGYGAVDWFAANAISSASSLFLQPPNIQVSNFGQYAQITLLPFPQTRRDHEIVVSVNSTYVWPNKNEYTLSDITASGATVLYTSNGTDLFPTFVYSSPVSLTVTLIAFTTDGAGKFSRVNEYSPQPVTIVAQTQCFH